MVSDVKGTTTDPVFKTMEILPIGPVMLIDTPGYDDEGLLGELRIKKTKQSLNKTDIAVLVLDAQDIDNNNIENSELLNLIKSKNIPYIIVINKIDTIEYAQATVSLPFSSTSVKVSALKGTGIEELKNKSYQELSGGQQQRVAIARALINRPSVILADEPTGNLDTKTGNDVMKLLTDGIKKYGQTLILITHNEEIARMADRVICLKNGVLESSPNRADFECF